MSRLFITEGIRIGPDGSGYSCDDDDDRADSWDVVDSDNGAKYFGSEDYSTATRVSGVLNSICREHAAEVARLNEQVRLLSSEGANMRSLIDSITNLDNEPQYHDEGMGCGLEDRGITDRYEAMSHGWECAMERVYGEVIPCAEELDFPATDAILNEVRARAVTSAASHLLDLAKTSGTLDLSSAALAVQIYANSIRAGEVPNA